MTNKRMKNQVSSFNKITVAVEETTENKESTKQEYFGVPERNLETYSNSDPGTSWVNLDLSDTNKTEGEHSLLLTKTVEIAKIPFDSDQNIQPWRQKQIEQRADELIENYATSDNLTIKGTYSFYSFGETLKLIAKMKDLTEQEKALLWDNIMSRRDKDYTATTDGINKEFGIHSITLELNRALLRNGFHDIYHTQLANLSPEAASRRIFIQELNKSNSMELANLLSNNEEKIHREASIHRSNIKASEGQVAALREYKMHGFAGYAKEWCHHFLQSTPLE
jgi:hypothetical protein